ncbi:type II toxin-antitoxin system ParD family antitoxin [Candidatus Dependentiae bacterium]|nr:type II toxin-antitoxin system ParD family antitoxin [Alphaproteobacteria bacterium]MBM3887324.1 type II toxin-antitoxin system ParD family antitoxin [Candidatus Dependentiae bacterium]
MTKSTSIALGVHLEKFINKQIKLGNYGSVSETIRAGLRLLEEREVKLAALRKSLVEGENSGKAAYSLTSLKRELSSKAKKRARK